MRKLWIVAKNEYAKIVRKRSFLLGTLALPIFFIGIMVLSIVAAIGTDQQPVGYVDQTGWLSANAAPPADSAQRLKMLPFVDEAAAQTALQNKQIQAFYVLPKDYLQTGKIMAYGWDKEPSAAAQSDFRYFLRANLVTNLPQDVRQRALDGINLTARSADGAQEINGNAIINFFLPFALGLFFIMAVMNSATYLLQAVADEKENRTIEVMATSLSPNQLIGGKALGLIGVALTQIVILCLTIGIGLGLGSNSIDFLRGVRVPWSMLGVALLFFVPAYVLIAGMMIAVGAAVTEVRQGQQLAGALNMLYSIPYFFVVVFLTSPNSPL
ncbi:MAG TPA: ABC transporter permease, partial [Anaerolineae bacterium]